MNTEFVRIKDTKDNVGLDGEQLVRPLVIVELHCLPVLAVVLIAFYTG